jgi:uncharacterized protein YjbI with pentapeptide repeats
MVSEHFVAVLTALVTLLIAVAAIGFGISQFKDSLNLQTEIFNQQESRLQRQRYTELVDILWSVNKQNEPIHSTQLRRAAVSELLDTQWYSQLNISKSLHNARLENIDLIGFNFSKKGFNFSGVNLTRALVEQANFDGADLNKATLVGASFKQASLKGANLQNADLRWAVFKNADLQKADLTAANIKHADLRATNLSCEQLKTAQQWSLAYRDQTLACGQSIPVKAD